MKDRKGRIVKITKTALDSAIRGHSGHCMIADTIREQDADLVRVSVDIQTIRYTDKKRGLRYTHLTPRVAQCALLAFDKGEEIKPFAFQLNKPIQIHKAGAAKAKVADKPGGNAASAKTKTASSPSGKTVGALADPIAERQKRASRKPRKIKPAGSSVPKTPRYAGAIPQMGVTRQYGLRTFTNFVPDARSSEELKDVAK